MGTSTSSPTASQNGTKPDAAEAEELPLIEPVWVTANCNIKNLQTVTVEVNIMASIHDVNMLPTQLSQRLPQNTIRNVQGWPADKFGADPFGSTAPIAFAVWVAQAAVGQAVRKLANDPSSTTLPTISSSNTVTETSAAFQRDYATSL